MPHVLVVDDEEAIRRLLTRWLSGWGYEAKEAAHAESAVRPRDAATGSRARQWEHAGLV